MRIEDEVRALLGPADPARHRPAGPRPAAHELIARARTRPEARPRRRLVLAAAGAVVVAGGTAVAWSSRERRDGPVPDRPDLGPVLVPIAYEFDTDPGGTAARLRAFADRLRDTPSDIATGRYAYHHERTWGDPLLTDESRRFTMAYASETEAWLADDGSGRQVTRMLAPEFPDQASRDHYARTMPDELDGGDPAVTDLPPGRSRPLVAYDRASLSEYLQVHNGPAAPPKFLTALYLEQVPPRAVRAEVLRILAGVPGYTWRGEVTDRLGRPGLAITYDDVPNDQRHLLVFNPGTGELLAEELLTLRPQRLSTYVLVLETARTDRLS